MTDTDQTIKSDEPLGSVKNQAQTLDQEPWSLRLQRYIFDRIIPRLDTAEKSLDDQFRFDMVSNEVFEVWVRSFSHWSYEPDDRKNYRPLAFKGARLIDIYMADRLLKDGAMTTEQLRVFLLTAEWKIEKRRISRNLGLSRYLRTFFEISDLTEEELIESLIGALYEAMSLLGRETDRLNLALENFFGDYLVFIQQRQTINITLGAREELIQLHERLGWTNSRSFDLTELGKPKAVKKRGEVNSFEVKFEMTPQTITWLKNRGYDVTDTTLSTGRGVDRDTALETAIRNALVNLRERFDVSYATIAEEASKALPDAVKGRMAADEIVSLSTVTDVEGGRYILIGLAANGERRTLIAVVDRTGMNKTSVEQTMMDLYGDRGSTGEIFEIPA